MVRYSLLVVIVSFLVLTSFVSSLDAGMCVSAEVTSVNPSSVGADEDVTVGILIENCGEELPEQILFEITKVSKDISINEPLITDIGPMGYANSKRFLTFHLHTSPNVGPGKHWFETKLTYGKGDFMKESVGNFSVTVNAQEPDLAISRVYTNPEVLMPHERIVLTVDVENAGNGKAKDVRLELDGLDMVGVKSGYLGMVDADESVPARFVLETGSAGYYESTIKVWYKFGGEIHLLSFPLKVQVFEESNNVLYVVSIGVILALIVFILSRKSSKKS